MRLHHVIPALALLLVGAPAAAYDSKCHHPDGSDCREGPDAAHNRWIGKHSEHQQIWNATVAWAGLPGEVVTELLADQHLDVFTTPDTVTAGKFSYPKLTPVPFDAATQVRRRTYQVGELAQLPDFAYSLWDWASAMESCPLPEFPNLDAEECHGFASHMGPVNSNHFLPQSKSFYAYLHGLAITRAGQCKAMAMKIGAPGGRFDDYARACLVEAMTLEAHAQHYLQDAWSTGHMWERWGSPDLKDFPVFDFPLAVAFWPDEQRRYRAMAIAAVSGLIHGSKGLLQEYGDKVGWAIDDAMCAPGKGVDYIDSMGQQHPGLGDLFLPQLLDPQSGFVVQHDKLFSCAASAVRAVYTEAGELYGPLGMPDAGFVSVDPTSEACFGQRATNAALARGFGIDVVVPTSDALGIAVLDLLVQKQILDDLGLEANGKHYFLRLDVFAGLTEGVLTEAGEYGEIVFGKIAKAVARLPMGFTHELIKVSTLARLEAAMNPNETKLASGGLGPFFGAQPNGAYANKSRIASYIDPGLPWPKDKNVMGEDAKRSRAIASVFHRSHADDWCKDFDGPALAALKDHVLTSDTSAACAACAEITARHLRLGKSSADYDTSREPVCAALDGTAFVYHQPLANLNHRTAALEYCGCTSSLVLTTKGLARVQFQNGTATWGKIGPQAKDFLPLGTSPRAMDFTFDPVVLGSVGVVSNFGEGTVSLVNLELGEEVEIDVDGDPATTSPGAPAGISRIDLGAVGMEPRGVVITDDGTRALVAMSDTHKVAVIDLGNRTLCKAFAVDAPGQTVPDSIVISPDGKKGYVSMSGTAAKPGGVLVTLDMAKVKDCNVNGGEANGFITLNAPARPTAMSFAPDGKTLAVAGRANKTIILVDTVNTPLIHPTLAAGQFPSAIYWAAAGRPYWGNVGGPVGTPLDVYGTVQLETDVMGDDSYHVGVQGAVNTLFVDSAEAWVYVGDSAGNLTALATDLWDGSFAHQPKVDHTGGCIAPVTQKSVPCPVTLNLGSPIRQIIP